MQGVGKGDEKRLLEEFYRCVSVFKRLPSKSQDVRFTKFVIVDISDSIYLVSQGDSRHHSSNGRRNGFVCG